MKPIASYTSLVPVDPAEKSVVSSAMTFSRDQQGTQTEPAVPQGASVPDTRDSDPTHHTILEISKGNKGQ